MRRFVAEAVGSDVKQQPSRGHSSTARRQRIDRVASCRRQHELGRRQLRRPVRAFDYRANLRLIAFKTGYGTQQVWKTLQVTRAFKLGATHHGRESQNLGVRFTVTSDDSRQSVDYLLEQRGARVDAVAAAFPEHCFVD